MNIVADATVPGTRGSFMFDDEGTRTAPTTLIGEGVVRDFLSSRDSAARQGISSSGAARRTAGPIFRCVLPPTYFFSRARVRPRSSWSVWATVTT